MFRTLAMAFRKCFVAPFPEEKQKCFIPLIQTKETLKCFIPPIYSNDLQICFAPPEKTLLFFVMSLLNVIGALRPNQSLAPREC